MEKNLNQRLWSKDFIIITLVNFLLYSGFQMLLLTIPIHVKSLGANDSMVGLMTGAYTLSALIIRPFSGLALDSYGRKKILFIGLVVFLLLTLSYNLFSIVSLIALMRFIHGFGWGVATTATNTIATDIIPQKKMGEGVGYFSLSVSLAGALSPLIGIGILNNLNFTAVTYFSTILLAIACLFALIIHYPAFIKKESGKKIVLYEKKAISPSIIMFFTTLSYGAINSFISLYGIEKGISNVGIFFLVYALTLLLTRPLFGKVIDKFGYDYVIYSGLILSFFGMLVLSKATTLNYFLICAVLYASGFGAVQSALQTISVRDVDPIKRGSANATFYTGFDGGIGVGSVISGLIAVKYGYNNMYFLMTFSLVIAFILYIFMKYKKLLHHK